MDDAAALKYRAVARTLFGVTNHWHKLLGLTQFRRRLTLPDGTVIEMTMDGTVPQIAITPISSTSSTIEGAFVFIPRRDSRVFHADIVVNINAEGGIEDVRYFDETKDISEYTRTGTYAVYTESIPYYHGGVDWQRNLSWGYLPERYSPIGLGGAAHTPNYGAFLPQQRSGQVPADGASRIMNLARTRKQEETGVEPRAYLYNPFRMYGSQTWYTWENAYPYGMRETLINWFVARVSGFPECGTGEVFQAGKILVDVNTDPEDWLHEDSALPPEIYAPKSVIGAAIQDGILILATATVQQNTDTREQFFVGPIGTLNGNTVVGKLYYVNEFIYNTSIQYARNISAILFNASGTEAVSTRQFIEEETEEWRIVDYKVVINRDDLTACTVLRTKNEYAFEVQMSTPSFTVGPLYQYYGVYGYSYRIPPGVVPPPGTTDEEILDNYLVAEDILASYDRDDVIEPGRGVRYIGNGTFTEIKWDGETIRPLIMASGFATTMFPYINMGKSSLKRTNDFNLQDGYKSISRVADYKGDTRVVGRFEYERSIQESDVSWMTEMFTFLPRVYSGGPSDWNERVPVED